jgi:SSS family solute:Na+ symporter
VLFTLHGGTAIVPLLLLGYNFVTQLFPALVLSLPARQITTRAGAIAGILTGEVIVIALQVSGLKLATLFPAWPSVITDLNVGIVAMIANVTVLLAVSAMTRPAREKRP